jgi:cardiolipin synthase
MHYRLHTRKAIVPSLLAALVGVSLISFLLLHVQAAPSVSHSSSTPSAVTHSLSMSALQDTTAQGMHPALPDASQPPLQVFVEPEAGEQVILNAINNAQQSVWLETYLLTDTNIINALESAAGRGLDVRVMLEPNPVGGGSPQSTLNALQAAGAKTEDSSPTFTLTHEKGMIIDGTTAFIMSCNFTYSALNGKNREYGIIDTVPADVQGVINIFNADWNRTADQVTDAQLVVSPDNSRTVLTNFINSATTSLIVEAEEMEDSGVEQALVSAAERGVAVQVILPSGSSANAQGISTITAAGVKVEEDSQLYMHAKMMVADGKTGFVGSENFSSTSLDSNRELVHSHQR